MWSSSIWSSSFSSLVSSPSFRRFWAVKAVVSHCRGGVLALPSSRGTGAVVASRPASTAKFFHQQVQTLTMKRQQQQQQQQQQLQHQSHNQQARVKSTTTTTAATGASTPKSGKSFMEWYESHLKERPVVTKMITGAFLWGLGDAVAQIVPQAMIVLNSNNNGTATGTATATGSDNDTTAKTKQDLVYDWPRTGRAVWFGFALHAPTAHLHYNFLEWLTVRTNVTGLYIPVFKAFMEQFVYWSWLSNSMYHGAMGAMQGQTPTQIYNRIADVLWETQKAQWVFWIPIQLLNFQFVPVRHQLNVVLLTSIVWTALLSAWYPPQQPQLNENNENTAKSIEKGDTK